jgi:rRNA maturation endonuclease Nob1
VYTNLMATMVRTPMELALLRGDSSLTSSITYMSKLRVINEVQQGLEDMYTEWRKEEAEYKETYSNPKSIESNSKRNEISQDLKIAI